MKKIIKSKYSGGGTENEKSGAGVVYRKTRKKEKKSAPRFGMENSQIKFGCSQATIGKRLKREKRGGNAQAIVTTLKRKKMEGG